MLFVVRWLCASRLMSSSSMNPMRVGAETSANFQAIDAVPGVGVVCATHAQSFPEALLSGAVGLTDSSYFRVYSPGSGRSWVASAQADQ